MMTLRSLSLSPGNTGAISCVVPASTTGAMCCYCGCNIGKGLDSLSGVEAPACVLCALVQTLVRPRIDEEACIVWVPELSQPAMNVMIRRLHLTSSPSELADALLRLPAESHRSRDRLLGGGRLLSLGKLYDGTSDIYPEIVDSWAANRRSGQN
jgi:hypothetical protein